MKTLSLILLMILPLTLMNGIQVKESKVSKMNFNTQVVDSTNSIERNFDIYRKTVLIYDVYNITYKSYNDSSFVKYNMSAVDINDEIMTMEVYLHNDGQVTTNILSKES